MKKLIPFLALFLLVGCSAHNYSPTIPAKLNTDAVYSVGDFSFSCRVRLSDGAVTVTPTSTKAVGMSITCDGYRVTYDRRGMKKSFDMPVVTYYNPAVVLYQVFSSLPDADVSAVEQCFRYSGTIGIGDYSLIVSQNGDVISLSVPSAEISVDFSE